MEPHPKQKHADLHHAVWWPQQEVTRPKARFKHTSPKKSGVDAENFLALTTHGSYYHRMPSNVRWWKLKKPNLHPTVPRMACYKKLEYYSNIVHGENFLTLWGELSLYGWRPVLFVWIQLLSLCRLKSITRLGLTHFVSNILPLSNASIHQRRTSASRRTQRRLHWRSGNSEQPCSSGTAPARRCPKAGACGQSYKHFTLVNYDSRVVLWGIFQSGTTLDVYKIGHWFRRRILLANLTSNYAWIFFRESRLFCLIQANQIMASFRNLNVWGIYKCWRMRLLMTYVWKSFNMKFEIKLKNNIQV